MVSLIVSRHVRDDASGLSKWEDVTDPDEVRSVLGCPDLELLPFSESYRIMDVRPEDAWPVIVQHGEEIHMHNPTLPTAKYVIHDGHHDYDIEWGFAIENLGRLPLDLFEIVWPEAVELCDDYGVLVERAFEDVHHRADLKPFLASEVPSVRRAAMRAAKGLPEV